MALLLSITEGFRGKRTIFCDVDRGLDSELKKQTKICMNASRFPLGFLWLSE